MATQHSPLYARTLDFRSSLVRQIECCIRQGSAPDLSVKEPFRLLHMSTWTSGQQLCISYTLMLLQLSASSVLILVNKWILTVVGFNFPIALSSLGMLFSSVATFLLIDVFQVWSIPEETRKAVTWQFHITRMWPVAAVNAITLSTGNYAYLYLSVSIIQVLKSFTPVITLAILVALRMASPRVPLVASVSIITAGCAMAAWGEVNAAGKSTAFGIGIFLLSELAECIRVVLIQYFVEGRGHVQLNAISTLYYMAPPTFVVAQLIAIPLEYPGLLHHGGLGILHHRWMVFAGASSMGFAVNLLAFLVIQTANGGSLTFKSAQMVKNALLVVVSAHLFSNVIAPTVIVGYIISLIGFAWYTCVSTQIKRQQPDK